MKCTKCGTEMMRVRVEEKEDTKVFHYKCPNPKCDKKDEKEIEK